MQHMFDKERYAVFHATVTIMELASLPGGIGEYRVEYKFRGHTPSGREMKPSESSWRPLSSIQADSQVRAWA